MNFTALMDRLDDRINPIVVKELRQAVKSRIVVGILLLFLGLQLFMLGFTLLLREGGGESITTDWNAGSRVFAIQQGILLWTIMILVPAYAAIRLAAERADQNVDLMFISTLRPVSIVWGKFFAAVVLGMLIFSACAPFMTFTYLLRGIDIPTILLVLGIDLLAMLYGVMLALFLAAVPGPRPVKFFFCFIGFIALATQCGAIATPLTIATIEFGGVFDILAESWPLIIVGVLAVLAAVGLMSFYTVALISPPSANRIFPLRLFLFGAWVVLSASLFIVSQFATASMSLVPIFIYLLLVPPILQGQFLISICERDTWGLRVARTIPRRWFLRPLAWLFYTGAAGGVTYSLVLLVGTLASAAWWTETATVSSGGPGLEAVLFMLRAQVIISLYVLCYGLSAVLVRTYLMADQVKANMNWLIAMLLVGLGSSIPSVIAYLFFWDQFGRPTHDTDWWALPNPFMALYNVGIENRRMGLDDFETVLYWFLGIWAWLVAVLSFPWYRGQLHRFRPPKQRAGDSIPVPAFAATEPTADAVPVLASVGAGGTMEAEPLDEELKDKLTVRRPMGRGPEVETQGYDSQGN